MSKIFERLYIGGWREAADIKWLKKNKITHILCAANDLQPAFTQRFTNKHLPLTMQENFNALPHLDDGANFIMRSLEEFPSCVMIYDFNGNSRATSVLIAFMMKYLGMDYLSSHRACVKLRQSCKISKWYIKQCQLFQDELCKIQGMKEMGQMSDP